MSATAKKKKGTKKRAARATSNVFAQFDQSQIQEFKEAFNMIDQNRDGFIDLNDLKDMWESLGQGKPEEFYQDMLDEATGSINFTMFLTLFADKLNGTDPEDVIRNAFSCFDPERTGKIHEDLYKNLLMTVGDRFTEEEFDSMCYDAPLDAEGNFDYLTYTKIIKHGQKEDKD